MTPPAPLLAPAIGVIVGIIVSQEVGLVGRGVRLAAIALATGIVWLSIRRHAGGGFEARSSWARVSECARALRLPIVLGVIGAAAGFVRDQSALALPETHIARAAADQRQLMQVEGVVVTAPAKLEWAKRNPFTYEKPRRLTRFVMDARGTRAGESAALEPACGLMRVTVEAERLEVRPGDHVVVKGWLAALRGPENPGEDDFAALSRRRGIHVSLTTKDVSLVRVMERGGGWLTWLDDVRNAARRRMLAPFDHIEDEPARLLDAMVLGQRSSAGQAISQAFLRTGTIHFLSVSGFHVGLLGGVTWLVMRWVLRRGARTAACVTLVVLLAYCAIAEPNSPILRATAMGVLACVAVLIDRPMGAVNWLAASALGILLISPAELFDGGFQLSFVQVSALLIVVPSLVRPWLRPDSLALTDVDDLTSGDADTWHGFGWLTLKRFVVSFVATAFVCWLAAFPLTLYHFGQVTPWGALQSILIAPLVIVVSLLGFLTLLLHALSVTLGAPVGAALAATTGWLMTAADWLSRWPGTYLEQPTPPAWLVWLMYVPLILAWLGFVKRTAHETPLEHARLRRRAWRLRGCALATALIVGGAWLTWDGFRGRTGGDLVLHVLSVGGGSAAIVVEPGGAAALFDCGTQLNRDAGETVLQAMRELGVQRPVEFLAVSHANSDHFSGIETIVEQRAAERFVCSSLFVDERNPERGNRRIEAVIKRPVVWETIQSGATLTLGGVTCEVLWPPPDLVEGWKENDRSLVLRLHAHGRRILLTGDIEQRAMRELLALHAARQIDLRSDVLIAPHHGSVTTATDEFYRAVEPEVVIVSAGDARDRLKRLVRRELGWDCEVWTTREWGAITVRIRPDCSYKAIPFRHRGALAAGRIAAGRQ